VAKHFDPKGTTPGGLPMAVEYRAIPCPACGAIGVHQLHDDLAVLSQCASPVCDWSVHISWREIEGQRHGPV
jgi:hypothetical protein